MLVDVETMMLVVDVMTVHPKVKLMVRMYPA